jgi:hypothetical protein
MSEAEIIVTDREQLLYLLQEASEIEHNLMCCYLYAAFSLKQRADEDLEPDELAAVKRWRKLIFSICHEEMVHLALVGNLMVAVGGAPYFGRPNFPVSPGYYPSGVVVQLAPFDLDTLDHFIFLERPEGIELADGEGFEPDLSYERPAPWGRLMPSGQDYLTVGHLYRGIAEALESLAQKYGEDHLFIGPTAAQLGPDLITMPGMRLISDLETALLAMNTIIDQGEGSQRENEESHYQRFLGIRAEFLGLRAKREAFVPGRPAARNPVMRQPPDPEGRVYIDQPEAARILDLANALYVHMLRCLSQSYCRPDGAVAQALLLDAAIGLMHVLPIAGQLLTELPASEAHPGVNAGMSFANVRNVVHSPYGRAETMVLSERLDEIADVAEALSRHFEVLSGIGPELRKLAVKLRKHPV